MSYQKLQVKQVKKTSLEPIFLSIETCAYSGATLLSLLLGLHPNVATIGELDGLIDREDPELYVCSCGQRILDCEFWQDIAIVMQQKGFEFNIMHLGNKYDLGGSWVIRRFRNGSFGNKTLDSIRDFIFETTLKEKYELKKLVARDEALIDSILCQTGKKVFVDSSKGQRRARYMLKFSSFDVRFIHLVRDVRGVVASNIRRNGNMSVPLAAKLWVKVNNKIERMKKSLSANQWQRIHYERLCLNPDRSLNHIFTSIGLHPTSFIDFNSFPHHIIGNEMRLNLSTEIRMDERWKEELNFNQLKEIDRIAGHLNRQYGYE